MTIGILGKKLGMAHMFCDGVFTPVTIIEAGPCAVLQTKTEEKDGYSAVQLGFEDKSKARINKPEAGAAKKLGKSVKRMVREFRLDKGEEVDPSQDIDVSLFETGTKVDVIGTSKGRGFQGVVKRYGFGGGRASHGGDWTRKPGSIGMCATPSRVHKGKKMPGHMGAKRITTRGLKVVEVDTENGLLVVKGAVPGPNGGYLTVRKTNKVG